MNEFKYDITELELDFYGDSKIDVFHEDEIVLEVVKENDELWVIFTSIFNFEENLILIKQDLADKLIELISTGIKNKFGYEVPVVLHPNFFFSIEELNSN